MYIHIFLISFFLLQIYLEVELLSPMVVVLSKFRGISILFSLVAAPVYNPINNAPLLFLVFFIIPILTGVSYYLTVVWICISLLISNLEHLSMYLLACDMHCWKNAFSDLLLTFHSNYFILSIYEMFPYRKNICIVTPHILQCLNFIAIK